MARGSSFAALLFCGAFAACGDAPSEPDVDAALTGGHQEPPAGTGGAAVSTASGGVEGGTGGSIGSGGIVGAGGTVGEGGSIGSGGTVGSGGAVSDDGSIGSGGGGGQGGRAGTGGAGNTGSTVPQGGTTGSTTAVDLSCNTDDDCCVRVDTCRAIAVLYSKVQGLVYWPPSTSTSCLRCVTPMVEVSCRNNQCTGTALTPGMSGTSHCGKLPSAGSGGTTGTTTGTRAVDVAFPEAPAFESTQQLVFGCG